jgi:hypothetical protein
MRTLNRNKRLIHYANQVSEIADQDEYGNLTGETTPIYGATNELYCNISAATGVDAVEAFGSFTNYSRTICVADVDCPIDEKSIVWFGVTPPKPHNYIVVRKADSKNGVLYALREVTVT